MKVAVGIICDQEQRYLVTQRPMHAAHGGFWEFPGGKLEPMESAEQALIREIREEVGLAVISCQYLGEVHHQYSEKQVHLLIYKVNEFVGEASCLEGQMNLAWLGLDAMKNLQFPEANQQILAMLY